IAAADTHGAGISNIYTITRPISYIRWYSAFMGSVLALDELLDQRLEDELDEIAGFLNAQHARLVGVTARLLANPGTWQVPGIHTIEQYLCWRTGISAAHAHQIATIARRGDELPVCTELFHRGELSLDQMTAIVTKTP